MAVVAVDPSATSATGSREKNLFFCGNFPPPSNPKKVCRFFLPGLVKRERKRALWIPEIERESERA